MNGGGIGEDEVIAGQAAMDLPQRGGEGAAGVVLGAIAPEELGQVIPVVRPIPVHDQVYQQRLRLEGGGQGEIARNAFWRLSAAEAEPAQAANFQFQCHRPSLRLCGSDSLGKGGFLQEDYSLGECESQ